VISIKINFADVEARMNAARSLQDAGEDADAARLLRKLAKDILDNVKEKK
jgi:hypothetical protein